MPSGRNSCTTRTVPSLPHAAAEWGDSFTWSRASPTAAAMAGSIPFRFTSGGRGVGCSKSPIVPQANSANTKTVPMKRQVRATRPKPRERYGEAAGGLFTSFAFMPAPSLSNDNRLIRLTAGKSFFRSVGPDYSQGVDAVHRPQAEMSARVIAAQIAGARVNHSPPTAAGGVQRDFRSRSIPVQSRIECANHQPVALLRRYVSEYLSVSADISGNEIDGAIPVQIGPGQAAADGCCAAKHRVLRRNVVKPALAFVGKDLIAIGILRPEGPQRFHRGRIGVRILITANAAVG